MEQGHMGVYVSLFDTSGNSLLTRYYNFGIATASLPFNENIYSAITQSKHMLLAFADTNILGAGFSDIVVCYLDSNLDVVWTKALEYPADVSTAPTSLILAHDGNFLITANGDDGSLTFPEVFKLDTSGNILWNKRLDINYGTMDLICKSLNGDYIVSGTSTFGNFIGRIDDHGSFRMIDSFYDTLIVSSSSICETANGQINFLYARSDNFRGSSVFVQMDSSGQILSGHAYGALDLYTNFITDRTKGFYFSGVDEDTIGNVWYKHFNLMYTDSNGNGCEATGFIPDTLNIPYTELNSYSDLFITVTADTIVFNPRIITVSEQLKCLTNTTPEVPDIIQNIYPIPAGDYINIQLQENVRSQISIYNSTGQQLAVNEILLANNIFRLDLSNFADGYYVLCIDQTTRRKIIIARQH
jgi:hypothetical protein